MDLSKLKKHRGTKDAQALEEVVSGYRKQMQELQGQINQMTPNMRVSLSFIECNPSQKLVSARGLPDICCFPTIREVWYRVW